MTNARTYEAIAPMTDFTRVIGGRRILHKHESFRTIIAGASGSVRITPADGSAIDIEAPFVIDTWCADDHSLATIEVTAATTCDLILLNIEHRDAAFAMAGDLAKHSHQTVHNLLQSLDVTSFDVTSFDVTSVDVTDEEVGATASDAVGVLIS